MDTKTGRRATQKDLTGSVALDQEDWPVPVVAEPQDGVASISLHQQSMIIILAQRPYQGVPQAMVAIGEEKDFPPETKPKSIDLPVLLRAPGATQAQNVFKRACIFQMAVDPNLHVACKIGAHDGRRAKHCVSRSPDHHLGSTSGTCRPRW